MKIKKSIQWASLIFFIGLSVIAAAFLIFRAKTRVQTIDDLNTRLTAKGIPVQSIIVVKPPPFVIKISLRSKSEDKNLQPEDLYYAQIARKAATLFYRHGQKIDGYEVVFGSLTCTRRDQDHCARGYGNPDTLIRPANKRAPWLLGVHEFPKNKRQLGRIEIPPAPLEDTVGEFPRRCKNLSPALP